MKKKLKLIFLSSITVMLSLFVLVSCTISKTKSIESTTLINPKLFNEKLAASILNGNREIDKSQYFTKEELRMFMESTTPQVPEEIILKELNSYDTNYVRFEKDYSDSFKSLYLAMTRCSDIEWEKCSIDSSIYEYTILVPNGRDEKIAWPQSKNYKLANDKMIAGKGWVFVSQDSLQYVVRIDSWHFNGTWKFYNNLTTPSIARMK